MCSKIAIDANKATVERFLAGTHSGRIEVVDTTVAENIVTHGFPGGNPTDRESYKQFFRDFGQSFSDMRFEMLGLVADARLVAVRFLVEVSHTGPFAGCAPTGRRVSFTGMALYRLREARICETRLQLDELALLAQVGAIPHQAAA